MTGSTSIRFWVGIDWATEAHQVCVLDAHGAVLEQRTVAHQGDALVALADALLGRAGGDATRLAVAIERPDGAVVETLLEHGVAVYAINPKQLDRFRDRHTVAGAKDDRRDAFVLADALRTDLALYRRVRLDAPTTLALREASRLRAELTAEFGRLTHRLREQLLRFYPQVLALGALDAPWCWQVLTLAPTPQAAARVRPTHVQQVLTAHRIRRHTGREVLAILRQPALHVAPGVAAAASLHIASLLRRLRVVHDELRQCDRQLAALLQPAATSAGDAEPTEGQTREHRDAEIILSLPGVGITVAATMLAEAAGPLEARDYHALRLRAGVAPVTLQTGKQRQPGGAAHKRRAPRPQVQMRHACNERLREAAYHMARVAAQHDAHWKQLYTDARARGVTHGAACRVVADRMLSTLIAMLRTRTLYDPTRFAQAHTEAA